MANDTVKIEVELASDSKSFARVEKDAREAGIRAGEQFASGLSAKIIALGATGLAGLFSKKSIDAAIESEKAVNAFNQALARTGQLLDQNSESFQSFAAQLQKSTGIADEQILGVSTKLLNLAGLTTSELRRATQATIDFSVALGVDLETAATLVGKAANGNVTAFQRLGFEIRKGKTDAETFANTLAVLEGRFSGAAAGATQTFAGSLLKVQNSFGDLLEEIGKIVTQSPSLVAVFNIIADSLDSFSKIVTQFAGSGDVLKPIISGFLTLGAVIVDFVVRPLEIAFNVLNIFYRGTRSILQLLVSVFATFADAIGEVLGFFNIIKKETVSLIDGFRKDSLSLFEQFNKDFANAVSIDGIGSQGFSDKLDEFVERSRAAVENAKPIFQDLKNSIGKAFQDTAILGIVGDILINRLRQLLQISDIVKNGLVQSISVGVQALGASLVKGASAFQDFGKAILGIVGDILINVGVAIIATSQAVEALRATLTTLFGGFGIAAGLALIALGGALKAIGGGGLANAATGNAGGAASAPTTQPTDNISPDNLVGQSSRVTINIQGDWFNTRDSGLRIIELLQDVYDTDGASVVTG
jgi:hypothetical protein